MDQKVFIYNYDKQVSKAIQELIGVSGSILFDGQIDENEIKYLQQWLVLHGPYLTKYPLVELKEIIDSILEDGTVTQGEKQNLFNFLSSISIGVEQNPTVEGIFELNPRILFNGNNFLFTGELLYSERDKAESLVIDKGGKILKSCNKQLNYLIVGSKGSEAWKFGRFGTKVSKAIELNREKKAQISIIQEKDFVRQII